jgi:DNA repair exonuclease SbcCD ATPase subunit
MKKIALKSLELRNFKGIDSLKVDFNETDTTVAGANGTGKTTVFDAFTWLLWGKDSHGRSDFGIKKWNLDGNQILKLNHEVRGVFSVNGRELSLRRVYLEKWEQPRGTTNEVLKSHFSEFYVNEVKQPTKLAYELEIAGIIPEDVFRMITDVWHFTSRPAMEQRAMLLDMAGDICDRDIAALKPEFGELLEKLNGRKLENLNREIVARKRAIREELSEIPARIDTARQLMPQAENWQELETERSKKAAKVDTLENQIIDKSKIVEEEFSRISQIESEIGKKQLEKIKRENDVRTSYSERSNKIRGEVQSMEHQLRTAELEMTDAHNAITNLDAQIANIEAELTGLRAQYRTINKEKLIYPENAFICPTCLRPFEADDILLKQSAMQENFNQNKSLRLQENIQIGNGKMAEKDSLHGRKKAALQKIAELEARQKDLQTAKAKKENLLQNESNALGSMLNNDADLQRINDEIVELRKKLSAPKQQVDVSDLQERKSTLNSEIAAINKRLAKQETIETNANLIAELEARKVSANQALADLERLEFIALDFQKAKDEELLKRVNGMFSIVKWSFIEGQLNGGERLTCICSVNGTPYPEVNNAGKINAGLDVINAICRAKGVSAPIFIDNSESVNELIPTVSQKVLLRVTTDSQLIIS